MFINTYIWGKLLTVRLFCLCVCSVCALTNKASAADRISRTGQRKLG